MERAGPAGAGGGRVAGCAAAAEVTGRATRERGAGTAGTARTGRLHALDTGAERRAARRRRRPGRCLHHAAAPDRPPLRQCRPALGAEPGAGADRAGDRPADAAPDAHRCGPLRHRRPDRPFQRADARTARRETRAVRALQRATARRSGDVRGPAAAAPACAERPDAGRALPVEPAVADRHRGHAPAGVQPRRHRIRLRRQGQALHRRPDDRGAVQARAVRPRALARVLAGRAAGEAAERRAADRPGAALRHAGHGCAEPAPDGHLRRAGSGADRPGGRRAGGLGRAGRGAARCAAAGAADHARRGGARRADAGRVA